MRRWFVIMFVFILLIAGEIKAQQGRLDPIRLNSMHLTGGVGAGAHYFGNGRGFGPAFKIAFEKGMWDLGPGVITIGGETVHSYFSQADADDFRETWYNAIFAGRAAWHYGWDIEDFDTYGGVAAGIGFCGHSDEDPSAPGDSRPVFPYMGFFVGASYFFSPSLGVNGELGYAGTVANIGVIYKLK